MSVLAFEVPATVAHEYQVLSETQRRQFGFELVFRLGQYSRSNAGVSSFEVILDKAQAEARRNGMNEATMQAILAEVGHAA
jgi:hypothetical protein